MKKAFCMSILLGSFCAWAQTSATTNSGTSIMTPKQTCTQLIEAAKNDNFEAAKNLMMLPDHKKQAMGKKAKSNFDKMHQDYLTEIRGMTCGTEQIAGDHAMVTATAQDEQRLIPFVQKDGQWKFDMRTYRAFYMGDKKAHKKSM